MYSFWILLIFIIFLVLKKVIGNALLKEETLNTLGPQGTLSFKMKCGMENCFQRIVSFANASSYIVESTDEENFKVALREKAENGFSFNVVLTLINENTTRVDIGIDTKSFQNGSIEKRQQDFAKELREAVLSGNY